MKKRNLLLQAAAISAFAISVFTTTPVTADAATAPKSTTISTNAEYSYSSGISSSGAIHVKLDDAEDYIGNIKSKNSSLKAKVTYMYCYNENSSSAESPYATIGLYAKKNLNTVVTFDIFDGNGKKKESKSVKVIAKTSVSSTKVPVKSATFAGKPITYGKVSTKNSGKVKVTMNKNFKLVKLEVGTYSAPKKEVSGTSSRLQNTITYKTIKNNAKIKLGTKCYTYSYLDDDADNNYYYSSYHTNILAPTQIKITYQDKKTKTTGEVYYIIYKIAK